MDGNDLLPTHHWKLEGDDITSENIVNYSFVLHERAWL